MSYPAVVSCVVRPTVFKLRPGRDVSVVFPKNYFLSNTCQRL